MLISADGMTEMFDGRSDDGGLLFSNYAPFYPRNEQRNRSAFVSGIDTLTAKLAPFGKH